MNSQIIYKEESYKIIGACFAVYKAMGAAFTEPIFHECLEIEFELLGIPFQSKLRLPLEYRGRILKQRFEPDFVCYDKIILEIKAAEKLVTEHRSQVLNYLNTTDYKLGLLVNFGAFPRLEYERLANTQKPDTTRSDRLQDGPHGFRIP